MFSVLECEATVLHLIHKYGELISFALRRPTTCSDPMGMCLIRESHMWSSTIFGSRRLINVMPICHQLLLRIILSIRITFHLYVVCTECMY